MELDLTFYDVTVQHLSQYTSGAFPYLCVCVCVGVWFLPVFNAFACSLLKSVPYTFVIPKDHRYIRYIHDMYISIKQTKQKLLMNSMG